MKYPTPSILPLPTRRQAIKIVFLLSILVLFHFGSARAEEEYFFPNATSTVSYYIPEPSSSSTTTNTTTSQDVSVGLSQLPPALELNQNSDSSVVENAHLIKEPMIRVGIAKTEKKVIFVSPFPYNLMSGGVDYGVLPENEVATMSYKNGVYSFSSLSIMITSSYKLRLVPGDLNNYFSILSLDRHLVSRSQLNFNTFRGTFEYWYSPKSQMPYLINELLLDSYVAGIGETSDGAPEEYIKALQIAARSYAYANISGALPSTKNMFDVYASTVDQLYLGYNFESFSPRVAFFSGSTRGLMVTYKEDPIMAFYFSRSNGQTKNKKNTPWLKSVVAKYDKGKKMLGHGYGMSNQDAIMRAKKDGWNYEQILTYYYSGTKVEKIY